MERLLLASGNAGKLRELRHMLDGVVEVLSPADVGLAGLDPAETETTFHGNALLKARAFASASGLLALADDSGLQVDALGGAPGVYSARYAGPDATDADNNQKLLAALEGHADRSARFRCALVLAAPAGDERCLHEGTCEGRILEAPRGQGGFGYDPLFLADGQTRTMAELPPDEKSAISHRGRAVRAFVAWMRAQVM